MITIQRYRKMAIKIMALLGLMDSDCFADSVPKTGELNSEEAAINIASLFERGYLVVDKETGGISISGKLKPFGSSILNPELAKDRAIILETIKNSGINADVSVSSPADASAATQW